MNPQKLNFDIYYYMETTSPAIFMIIVAIADYKHALLIWPILTFGYLIGDKESFMSEILLCHSV